MNPSPPKECVKGALPEVAELAIRHRAEQVASDVARACTRFQVGCGIADSNWSNPRSWLYGDLSRLLLTEVGSRASGVENLNSAETPLTSRLAGSTKMSSPPDWGRLGFQQLRSPSTSGLPGNRRPRVPNVMWHSRSSTGTSSIVLPDFSCLELNRLALIYQSRPIRSGGQ